MHAPCHVTCRQGVQNDHIFGILKFLPRACDYTEYGNNYLIRNQFSTDAVFSSITLKAVDIPTVAAVRLL